MNKLPKAKFENIVVNILKDEVLIYDLTTNLAFCLNETAANVFNACDGKTTFDQLKAKYNYTDEIIYLALDELKKNNLLADDYASPFDGMSRRQVIRKIGLASMIGLPIVAGIIAPLAANAASGTCPAGNIFTPGGVLQVGIDSKCQCNINPGNADSCNTTPGGTSNTSACRPGCICNIDQPLNCNGSGRCTGTCS